MLIIISTQVVTLRHHSYQARFQHQQQPEDITLLVIYLLSLKLDKICNNIQGDVCIMHPSSEVKENTHETLFA